MKLAFVLPRFGASLGGGAETLGRAIALALTDPSVNRDLIPVETVEIWTTCATDHRTWENALPAGVTVEDGLTVRRFKVDERNLETFISAEMAIAQGRTLSAAEQLAWLGAGVNSKDLYRHIAEHGQQFDALIFAPYLFPTSFWGPLIYPERSWLIPCLHNEPYAYQSVFRVVFEKCAGLLFNAAPEMTLAGEIFGKELVRSKGSVVGMGFEAPASAHAVKDTSASKYLLYSGRKEQGKNLDKLIEWFSAVRPEVPELELLLIGSGDIHFLSELPAGVRDLGFVSESEKYSLMANAFALCQPSTNESFSIVMMEAWLQGVPSLVHAGCDVTRDHVQRSGGGLYFANASDLGGVLKYLLSAGGVRDDLGAAGRSYVLTEYSWPAVLKRLAQALNLAAENETRKSEDERCKEADI